MSDFTIDPLYKSFLKVQNFLTERDVADAKVLTRRWNKLKEPIQKSIRDFAPLLKAGKGIYGTKRYAQFVENLIRAAEAQAKFAEVLIKARQLENAYQALDLAKLTKIRYRLERLIPNDFDPKVFVGQTINGIPLFDEMMRTVPKILKNVNKHLTVQGRKMTTDEISFHYKRLDTMTDLFSHRTVMIAQTEQMYTLHMTNERLQIFLGIRQWVWLALAGACSFCMRHHNQVHPAGDHIRSHPHCRCLEMPLDPEKAYKERINETYSQWYASQHIKRQVTKITKIRRPVVL